MICFVYLHLSKERHRNYNLCTWQITFATGSRVTSLLPFLTDLLPTLAVCRRSFLSSSC